MSPSLTAYADQLVRTVLGQLHASGVRHVVIAPGSRSTPLTMAFATDSRFTPWLHLDERSAAYFALGLARQRREPVAIVCTSGTAAANFAPAVVEAYLSRLPLVVLTADRPPELRDMGANQTIDQARVYGTHVKRASELPLADGSQSVLRLARSIAARAVALAVEDPIGPVHLNFPFREPLLEAGTPLPALAPETDVATPRTEAPAPAPALIASLASQFAGKRGVIYAGPEPYGLPANAIVSLAATLGWPVLAEPLSGVRAGTHDLSHVIDAYDPLLRTPRFTAVAQPEVALRFGAAATSRPAWGFFAARDGLREIVVDVAGGWRDAEGTASMVVHADAAAFCADLAAAVSRLGVRTEASWLALWQAANRAAREAVRAAAAAMPDPFEGSAPLALADALPDGATYVVGNSMPIRDTESFFPAVARDIRIVGTRGASGIDGVVSTAVGAAAANDGPVVLCIGDLSFFHDLNGLWPLRRYGLSLTVLLVNNDGGGIFHFLPQAEAAPAPELFEQWFGTPSGLDFRHAVALHSGRHEVLDAASSSPGGITERLRGAISQPGLTVLELRTDRVRNVAQHREVWARVDAVVASVLEATPAPTTMGAAR